MHKEAREELRVRLKLGVLELAEQLGVTKACREFDVPRVNLCSASLYLFVAARNSKVAG